MTPAEEARLKEMEEYFAAMHCHCQKDSCNHFSKQVLFDYVHFLLDLCRRQEEEIKDLEDRSCDRGDCKAATLLAMSHILNERLKKEKIEPLELRFNAMEKVVKAARSHHNLGCGNVSTYEIGVALKDLEKENHP